MDLMRKVKNCYRWPRRFFQSLSGSDLPIARQCRIRHSFFGVDNAGWQVAVDGLHEGSIAYSFGVGDSIQFDLELIDRFGMTIHAFDPSPRSIQFIRCQQLPDKFRFYDYGISGIDGMVELFPPRQDGYVSFSAIRKSPSAGDSVRVPVYRLSTIMKKLGHPRVDLLKMDVEGMEYDIIDNLLQENIPVGQLLVEFHHLWAEVGIERTKEAIIKLNQAGFRIFGSSPSGSEYSFIRQVA